MDDDNINKISKLNIFSIILLYGIHPSSETSYNITTI